jgi:hypothetical protein
MKNIFSYVDIRDLRIEFSKSRQFKSINVSIFMQSLSAVEVLSLPPEGISSPFLPSFCAWFSSGGGSGDVGDIFCFIVIQVEFLDFVFSPFTRIF